MTDDMEKLAEILSQALTRWIIATEYTFKIPFTTIHVGWSRMEIKTGAGTTNMIEIRICW